MKKQLSLLLIQKKPDDSANIASALEEAFPFTRVEKINKKQKFEQRLQAGNIDLVVSDYDLGWGNGLQVLQQVKSLNPKTPVLLYLETAYENKALEGMNAGLDDFVFKRQHSHLHLVTTAGRFLNNIQQRRELHDAQVRFQSLFENVPIGLYRTSPAGEILAANSALAEILRYPNIESLLGNNSTTLYVNPADRDRWRKLVEKEGIVHEFEIPIRRWDGAQIWVRDSGRVVRTPQGEVLYYEGSLEDITDRVQADEKLRFQAQLLDNVREAVTATDLDGRITYWSKGAEKLFGYPAEERIGQGIIATFAPEDREAEIQRIRLVKDKGSWRGQYLQKRKDGTSLWTDTFISLIKDNDGIARGLLYVDRDITELQRLHNAERDQREMAEALREAGAALNATLDFERLLDVLLQQAARLVPYEFGTVLLLEGGVARVARSNGFEEISSQFARQVTEIALEVERFPNLAKMAESGQPLFISDTRNYPGWVLIEGFEYVRSWIGAPLIAQSQLMGFFSLDRSDPGYYQSYHAERLAVFAAQAALALQNARLFAETIENLEREKGLNEMSQLISGTLDPPSLLPQILRLAVLLVDADAGRLAVVDPGGDSISFPYSVNLPPSLANIRLLKGEGISSQVIRTARPKLLLEYGQHPDTSEELIAVGAHGFIGVPILAGETCLGVLELINLDRKRQFNERDLRLAETIGHQAGMAIQNAQLFENTQRQIAESETLRQASAVLTSALELNQVLDQILVQLVKVVPYDSAAVFLLKSDLVRIVAARGFLNEGEVIGQVFPASNPLLKQAADTGKAVILKDAHIDSSYKGWVNTNYVHGWMGVPILVRGEVIGFLTIDSRKINAYGEAESNLAQAFAHHAAIAIENARLYQEALTAAERGLVLHRASQEINASLDPEALYQAIHLAAAQLMPSEAFVISRMDEEAQEIDIVYLIDRSGRSPAQRTPVGRGLTGHMIKTGKSLRIDDFSGDEGIESFHFGDPEEVRSILAVPMRRANSKVFGMLSAQSYQPNAYSDEDQTMLELLAAHAATAMENARLFAEVQRLAIIDPLTSMFNRRHFFVIAQSEFERARRYSRPLSIAMLDMDHFKQVNDIYGHLVGDQVLMQLAALCRENMRSVDMIGRYGGDEFIILMPETQLEVAYQVTERLRECVSETIIEMGEKPVKITASLGVAELDVSCTSLEVLLLHADRALYNSKQIGRNQASSWKGERRQGEIPGK